jgi:hypothetical protein
MKESSDSEYVVSQKLAYETRDLRGLEAEFEVVHCRVTKSPLQGMRWS